MGCSAPLPRPSSCIRDVFSRTDLRQMLRLPSKVRRGSPRSPNPPTPFLIGRNPSGSWGPIGPFVSRGFPFKPFQWNPFVFRVRKGRTSGWRFGWVDVSLVVASNRVLAIVESLVHRTVASTRAAMAAATAPRCVPRTETRRRTTEKHAGRRPAT